jgi:hypothetical protein
VGPDLLALQSCPGVGGLLVADNYSPPRPLPTTRKRARGEGRLTSR